jgi:DinB family protein
MNAATRAELIAQYRAGAAEVDSAVAEARALGPDAIDRRPAPTEWSARQVVHHLADSETMSATRIRRLIADDDPVVIQGYDEPVWATRLHYDRPIEGSLALVRAVRTATADLLDAMTEADWARRGTHSESGPYSADDWLEIYASHCHDHADQIRQAARIQD